MNRDKWTVTDPKVGREHVFEEWPSARAEAVDLALTRDRRPIVITFPNGIKANPHRCLRFSYLGGVSVTAMRNTFVHPFRDETDALFGIECDWCGLRQHGLTVTKVLAQGLADEHANECRGEAG